MYVTVTPLNVQSKSELTRKNLRNNEDNHKQMEDTYSTAMFSYIVIQSVAIVS